MPTSSLRNSLEKNPPILTKTSLTFSKGKAYPQLSTNSRRLMENSQQSRCARPPSLLNSPMRLVHQRSNSQNNIRSSLLYFWRKPIIFPPLRSCDHTINLDDSFVPKVGKIYSLTPKEQKSTEDFLEENLWLGRICPSNSPQAASFFFVDKKDSSDALWPCQDYWYINYHTIKYAYPLPLIQNLIDKVKDAKVFTKFDVQWGDNNICIQDGDQSKVAFITHKGLFKQTGMLFGLCNSPATFQQFMNDWFRDMITKGWLVIYMDDLLISSPNTHLNTKCTKWVLQRMKELDLHLKIKKCKFGISHIDYLGMILFPGHIEMDPTKLNGIRNWPTLTKVKDVRSFLGFTNFYRKFIGDYSNIACPLIDLTKQDAP